MTKQVRIENADTTDHELIVEVWAKGADGAPDTFLHATHLSFPTAMSSFTVWQNQYLVVKEKE